MELCMRVVQLCGQIVLVNIAIALLVKKGAFAPVVYHLLMDVHLVVLHILAVQYATNVHTNIPLLLPRLRHLPFHMKLKSRVINIKCYYMENSFTVSIF